MQNVGEPLLYTNRACDVTHRPSLIVTMAIRLLSNQNSSCIISMENHGVTELQTVTIETLEGFHKSNQTRYRHWHNHRRGRNV